jgi:hypothetical protein
MQGFDVDSSSTRQFAGRLQVFENVAHLDEASHISLIKIQCFDVRGECLFLHYFPNFKANEMFLVEFLSLKFTLPYQLIFYGT